MRLYHTLLFSLCFQFIHAQNITVFPYLQDVSENSTFVMWETDDSGTGTVEWGLSPFALSNTVNSNTQTGFLNSRIHTAEITGLSPDTKYYYRVSTASGAETYVYHFKTLAERNAEQSIRLVAVSDMQRDGSNSGVFQDIVEDGIIGLTKTQYAGDWTDLVQAMLIPGDLVPTGGIYSQWEDDFFDLADSLTPYVPIYPVPGNHEYYLNGLDNFIKYFHLPENGTSGNLEEWWYKDMSNIRIIGLDSNADTGDQNTQLNWLQTVLDNACTDTYIDFVFVELHHPFKSELWIPGENDFTGDVIEKLENFSTNCAKPSIHFFGHTHAYSRGQSRDHQHLWVNVATAGGAIDNWGEFPNADYEEFVKSQDEYGFVVLDVQAGDDPEFVLKRYSRGDENTTLNNVLRDEILIRKYEQAPIKPIGLFPFNDTINPTCFELKANPFTDQGDSHQAAQWQIATTANDFENTLVYDSWKQSENWYNEVNTQANDDLTDEFPGLNLSGEQSYFWRVRYRDEHLTWSEWSDKIPFFTIGDDFSLTGNLIENPNAENGTTGWVGQIESLQSNECGSVPAYQGNYLYAVGGVCGSESSYGTATQTVDISIYNNVINADSVEIHFSAFMRSYSGTDVPAMYVDFLDGSSNVLTSSNTISSNTSTWTEVSGSADVPANAKLARVVLEGTRNAGTDNDSYFDVLSLELRKKIPCSNYTPCPISKTLNDNLDNISQLVHTTETIYSTAQLQGNAIVQYKAGNFICLDKGFSAEQEVDMKIFIDGCN